MKNLILLFFIVLIACAEKKMENPTNVFLPGKRLGELKNKKLREASGLATSVNNPGFLWTQNDSGNDAEVFLVDQDLDLALTCKLKGIKNRDWEDIVAGPGPDSTKNYVYVAEIGDNDSKHSLKYIYRFEEPVLQEGQKQISITDFDTITFKLQDKKKDTEALLLDPNTKDLYIVSKREEPVYVYHLKYPYSTKDTLTATQVAALPLTQIVAGAFSPDGAKILMKNYDFIYYWDNPANKSIPELLKEKPQEVPYEEEPQGESITWARDGSGFYTLSEKVFGEDSYLYLYKYK